MIWPLRAHNHFTEVRANSTERVVFTLPKFTIPDDKMLVVEMAEQNGGRHQSFTVENADLVRAEVIDELLEQRGRWRVNATQPSRDKSVRSKLQVK